MDNAAKAPTCRAHQRRKGFAMSLLDRIAAEILAAEDADTDPYFDDDTHGNE